MKPKEKQVVSPLTQELDYRLSKWILKNVEQLLEPDEAEAIWQGLLSFYAPPTASVENVCGSLSGDGLGKYVTPGKKDAFADHTNTQKAGAWDG